MNTRKGRQAGTREAFGSLFNNMFDRVVAMGEPSRQRFCVIAAITEDGLLGSRGEIPWRHPEDIHFFKTMTQGSVVIMGRRTWDSLPKKPLPDRVNVIVTSDENLLFYYGDHEDNVVASSSFGDAVEEAQYMASREDLPIFAIGGAQVYEQALLHRDAAVLYLTVVPDTYPPSTDDVHFPLALLRQNWTKYPHDISLGRCRLEKWVPKSVEPIEQ